MLLDLPSLPFAGVCVCVRVLCTIIPGCEGQEDFAMHQLWLKYNQVVKIIIIIILLLLLLIKMPPIYRSFFFLYNHVLSLMYYNTDDFVYL